MTIASLIVDVRANTVQLQKDVEQIHGTMDKLAGAAGKLGILLGATFTVGAVSNFARELLRMGDDIVRVADRTGLTTKEVQQLGFIASQSGSSIDDFTSALGQMQKRLGSGNDAALGALKQLNLNFDELKRMGPYQQLELIAAAVAKIADPMRQAQIQTDLFGKGGMAILPALKAEFAALGDATPLMSDRTVRALDAAGDAFERFQLTVKVAVAESYNYARQGFDALIAFGMRFHAAFLDMTAGMLELAAKIPGAARLVPDLQAKIDGLRQSGQWWRDAATGMATATDQTTAAVGRLIEPVDRLEKAHTKTTTTVDAATKAQRRFEASVLRWPQMMTGNAIPSLDGMTQTFVKFGDVVDGVINNTGQDISLLLTSGMMGPADMLGNVLTSNTIPAIGNMTFKMEAAEVKTVTWRQNVDELATAFGTLGQIGGEGLGSVARGIGVMISGFSVALKGVDSFKDGLKSLKAGDTLSGITGIISGIGGIVGAAQAAIGAVKALWNWARGGEEGVKVNPARDSWFNDHGGLAGVNEGAMNAGLSWEDTESLAKGVFAAHTMDQFNAATSRYRDMGLPGFKTGTGGRFIDFGDGTPVMLHGRERVQTEREAGGMDLANELRDLRNDLPRMIRDAVLLVPA